MEPQEVCLSLSFVVLVEVGISHLLGPAQEPILWARRGSLTSVLRSLLLAQPSLRTLLPEAPQEDPGELVPFF